MLPLIQKYYPNTIRLFGYNSRNIPDSTIYSDTIKRRVEAKKAGDKATANALKLVLNTTYGATLNQYNDLYDPLMARSVCITGQLFLTELAYHLSSEIDSLKVISLNTDGILVSFDSDDYDAVKAIVAEWEQRTGYEMEEDKVRKYVAKDVNNYVEIGMDGEVKIKGGQLVRGIAPAGAFKINNNAVIVADALRECLAHDVPVADTIMACDDPLKFQLIAKASGKYSRTYQLIDGNEVDVQRCNRVYATADPSKGTLYKVHKQTGRSAKVSGLPEHCLIDNANEATINDIDREWYIQLAQSQVDAFIGKKKEKKKMAEAKKLNTYQKLAKARAMFLSNAVKKSGKNYELAYSYFELKDIVPSAIKIFEEVGLLGVTDISRERGCTMQIFDTENPTVDASIIFSIPFEMANTNKAVQPIQALGSSISYLRRFLWQVALDVCESDTIDSGETPHPAAQESAPEQPKAPAPQTQPVTIKADRKAAVRDIVAVDANASQDRIDALREICKAVLRKYGEKYKDRLNTIGLETGGYVKATNAQCEAYMKELQEVMNNG